MNTGEPRRNVLMNSNSTISIPPSTRIALGIDPGTAIVGYAIVMAQRNELSLLACDVICTPAKMP
ncbi:MAG TPA: crossover junction endodeoxyribonuclease RuvC, partial [Ktedonobacteraceae bacterium]|nr:crossover junction endodeoxyribonuclease RuvC [Ktedonobacteraceae bacterium]